MKDIVGLIPAAGAASRMGGLPKYLLPLPEPETFLLDVLCRRMACAHSLLIGANPVNRGLVEQYAPEGAAVYSVASKTMSETLLAARRWCADSTVIFGMPDSYWSGPGMFYDRLAAFIENGDTVAAACWDTVGDQFKRLGMVEIASERGGDGFDFFITRVVDKPQNTSLRSAWGALAWGPKFWQYIQPEDPHVGFALTRALADGVKIRAMKMQGVYTDCGTRHDYVCLLRNWREA